jgi:phosphoglycerate dehydrogenase-like enzyme
MSARIRLLDDDHVIRLARFALAGPGEVGEDWVRGYLAPAADDPAIVRATAHGLHPEDGVEAIPAGAPTEDASILIFRRGTIDAALVAAHPRLRLIQRLGARADGIDLAAAAARGVAVSCLPRPSLIHTAEHSILLMLALAKRLIECDAAVRQDRWDRARVQPVDGVAYNWAGIERLGGLWGRTLGIVGLGEVGSILAGLARGFAMNVVYANRRPLPAPQEERFGAAYRPLPALLREADFVALCAANLPENRGLMDRAAFALMKPTAFFVNTSRGRLVDEDALFEALSRNRIAGAGLDVHWQEPRPQPDRFASLPNVVLTPHCAAGPRLAVLDELRGVFDNCRAVLAGATPRHLVGPP